MKLGPQNAPGGFASWTLPPPRRCSGHAGDLDPSPILHPSNSKVGSTPGFDPGAQSYPQLDAIRLCVLRGDWMGRSFGWDRENRDLVLQQVWCDEDPCLLKGPLGRTHRSYFAPPPPSHDIEIIWKFGGWLCELWREQNVGWEFFWQGGIPPWRKFPDPRLQPACIMETKSKMKYLWQHSKHSA
jgi:hypothetical protein